LFRGQEEGAALTAERKWVSKVIFRIDDRMIHGQVIEGWVHALKLTRITVVSDRIKGDKAYSKLLEFSVPSEVRIDIFGIEEAAEEIENGYLDEEDTIILFEKPRDVIDLMDYGIKIKSLNVGCMHFDGCNRKIKRNIAVNEDDIMDFKEIDSMGTKVEARALPKDREIDLMELINRIK